MKQIYRRSLKALQGSIACALVLGSVTTAAAKDDWYSSNIERQDAITTQVGHEAFRTLRPAYRIVEGISDGLFNLMSLQALFPREIDENIRKFKNSDSYAIFEQEFRNKEVRFLHRLKEAFPQQNGQLRRTDLRRTVEGISWAGDEQVSVALDALKDTILTRYQLEQLGEWAGDYAKDPKNWDGASVTMAAVVGGTFLYLNGMHTEFDLGKIRFGLDLDAGLSMKNAIMGDGNLNRAVGLEVGLTNELIAFNTDWGVDHGSMKSQRWGMKFRRQF